MKRYEHKGDESVLLSILLTLVCLIALLVFLSWLNAYHPADNSEVQVVCYSNTPHLQHGQRIKVITYNIQFLAGRNYIFFYDTPGYSGPDMHVKLTDIVSTADRIARLIVEESPDIILFQEIDSGSRRTHYVDELSLLLNKLPADYSCYTSAFYWKVKFVPHPKLWGSVGVKIAIVSKFRINSARRYNLPTLPINFLLRQFINRPLILQAILPLDDGSQLFVMNTHLDAFTLGTDILTKQLNSLRTQIHHLNKQNVPWILAGDFNLLPPGQYQKIIESHRSYYNSDTELKSFYEEFNVVPPFDDVAGKDAEKWFTYFGTDPQLTKPDRTLDYIVFSRDLNMVDCYVRQNDTSHLSDHFPVIASFEI